MDPLCMSGNPNSSKDYTGNFLDLRNFLAKNKASSLAGNATASEFRLGRIDKSRPNRPGVNGASS